MLRGASGRLPLRLTALALVFAAVVPVSCASSPTPRSAQHSGDALSAEVRQKVCAAACTGPQASIRVFRNTRGSIGSLRFDGDPGQCSHPPSAYFDPQGRKLVVIPFRPLVRGSPEHRRIMAIHEHHTKDLEAAETISCKP